MSSPSVPIVIYLLCLQFHAPTLSLPYNVSADPSITGFLHSTPVQLDHSNPVDGMEKHQRGQLLLSGSNPYLTKIANSGVEEKIVQQKLSNFFDPDVRQQHIDDGFSDDGPSSLRQLETHDHNDLQYVTQQKETSTGRGFPVHNMKQHPRLFAYPPLVNPLVKHLARRPGLSMTGEGKYPATRPLSNYYPFYGRKDSPSPIPARMANRRRIQVPGSFYNPFLPFMMHPFPLYSPFRSSRTRTHGRPFMLPAMYRPFASRAAYLRNRQVASHQHTYPGVGNGHQYEQQREEEQRKGSGDGARKDYFDDDVKQATDSKKGEISGVKRKQQFNPRKFSSQIGKNSSASYGTSFYPLTSDQVQQLRIKLERLKQEKDQPPGSRANGTAITDMGKRSSVASARGSNRKTSWSQ